MSEKLSTERARAFDYVFDAVLVLDNRGCVTDLNLAAESLTGRRRDDCLGCSLKTFFSQGSPVLDLDAVYTTLTQHGFWRGENHARDHEGQPIAVETMVVPLFESGQLNGVLCINRDISQRRRHEQKLMEMAHTDQLTGLPNRTLLLDRVRQMLAHNRRTGQNLAVLFLDLDGFKDVNDQNGHAVGDQVLRAVSRRMQRVLRENDTLARWGGDEFCALLAAIGTDENAERVADKLLQTLEWPVTVAGRKFHVGVSIGIALSPQHGEHADTLMRLADNAMYEAKKAGRQRYQLAHEDAAKSAA